MSIFGPQEFAVIQLLLLLAIVIAIGLFLSRHSRESHFRRDAFQRPAEKKQRRDRKAQEREQLRTMLGGFSFTGLPHEILGVGKDASEFEIRRAHRSLMKRFHPDKVGTQGSREWYEAQKIAESLNSARDQMLFDLKNQSS